MDKMPWYSIFLESFPEAMVFISAGLVLIGYNVKENFKFIALTALSFSVMSFIIRSLPIQFGIHILVQALILIILVILFLRQNLRSAIIVILLGGSLLMLFEITFVSLYTFVFKISLITLTTDPILRTFVPYIHLSVLSLLTLYLKKKNINLLPLLYNLKSKIYSRFVILTFLLIILTFITITIYFSLFVIREENFTLISRIEGIRFLNILLLIFLVITALTIKKILNATESQAIFETQELYLKNLNDLYNSLRSLKHDYANQIQIIHALLENNEIKEAKAYINSLCQNISDINKVIQVKNPVITALLQTKMVLAETLGLNFSIDISTNFDEIPMNSQELTRILGNLLDNAFEATQTLPTDQRTVNLSGSVSSNFYIIEISNSGLPISEEIISAIFSSGYTTKNSHSGLGLTIVKKLLDKYKGDIGIKSDNIETKFTIIIPFGKRFKNEY